MSDNTQLPVVVIACKIFENLLEHYLPPDLSKDITFLDYGLHSVPRNLKTSLQERIDQVIEPSLIVLGFGLCGNGLHGIKAGQHILLVPRTDDCISILLGSYAFYREQFETTPGTYYLSKGWLESGTNPLDEYRKYIAKYGPEQAIWLMDQQYTNYIRLAFVAFQQADLEQYRGKAMEIAEFCQRWGMRYEEILGSDQYIRKLVEVAQALDKADSDFIVIPPGGVLQQTQFFR